MHSFVTYIAILLTCQVLTGQEIQVIQPPEAPDSSYYDIFKVNDNEYWAAGENGILVSLDSSGNLSVIDYPSLGVDILKIDRLDDDELLLVGKEGVIYYFNRATGMWRVQQVPGYKKKVFYETAVMDDHTVYIAGGMSKIADSKSTLPRGFIIRSTDKGETWVKVYSNPLAMIWDVDRLGDSLMAVMFNPFSSKRMLYSQDGMHWQAEKAPNNGLYHHFDAQTGILAGGTQMNMRGRAIQSDAREMRTNEESVFWWSSKRTGQVTVAAGSNGTILAGHYLDDVIRLPIRTHLYEIAPISNNSAYVVGSGRTIVKITINGSKLVYIE